MNDVEIKDKPCDKDAPVYNFFPTSDVTKQKCLERCPDGFHQESDVVSKTHTKTTKKFRVTYCVPVDDEGNKLPLELSENAKLNREILRAGQDIVKFGDDNIIDKFPARVKEDVYYLEDIPDRGIKKGDLRYQRLKTSIDPGKITSKKALEIEQSRLLQDNNYVACASAAKNMMRDKNIDDDRIFHSFAWLTNIQRNDTLAKDVFETCRDVAYREVHEKNARNLKAERELARDKLERADDDQKRELLAKEIASMDEKMAYYDDKIRGITCDLGIGKRVISREIDDEMLSVETIPFVKNPDEFATCCNMVITEQNRRKAEGLRRRPKAIDAVVDHCIALDPALGNLLA